MTCVLGFVYTTKIYYCLNQKKKRNKKQLCLQWKSFSVVANDLKMNNLALYKIRIIVYAVVVNVDPNCSDKLKIFFSIFREKMCKMNSIFVTFLVVIHYQIQVLSQLASNREMEELTEELFKLSSPNLLPYVKINLQGKTSRWSHWDDANSP